MNWPIFTNTIGIGSPFPSPKLAPSICFFVKLNLKIEYTNLYGRLIWDYKNANIQLINHAFESFDWEKSFDGKNFHRQVYLFNKIILNKFHSFIPQKIIIRNDKDLPWFIKFAKSWIRKMNHWNSLSIMRDYEATMINSDVSTVTW